MPYACEAISSIPDPLGLRRLRSDLRAARRLRLPGAPAHLVARPAGLDQLVSRVNVDALEARVNALNPSTARAAVAWFLDIDGVLNIIGRPPRGGWGRYEHTTITNAFSTQGWPICYSATLVRLLNQLHQKGIVSFRWLTTWEHEAPTRFAPAVGLNLGAWIAGEDHGNSQTWWKLDVFTESLSDATDLVIWTDDDIKNDRHARRVVDFLHPDQALVICPDERKGISPEDFDLILSTLERRAARS